MKRAFLTGATGLVGAAICRQLLAEGITVHAIRREGSSRACDSVAQVTLEHANLRWFSADLGNPAVTALKGKGMPVLCWTVRSPDQEKQARQIADNITFEGYAA